jgi:hypothetical protein
MFPWKQLNSNRGTVFSVRIELRCYNLDTFRSPLGLVTIFYCLRFETSLFFASYDPQGYGERIRPRASARIAPKSPLLTVVVQLLPLEHVCLWCSYSVTAVIYVLNSRSSPSNGSVCHSNNKNNTLSQHLWSVNVHRFGRLSCPVRDG